MNRKSRLANSLRNAFWGILSKAFLLFFHFILRIVFIRVLGIEYLGLNTLLSDILIFLSLADLGLNTAMVYSFYQPLSNNNIRKLSALVLYYKKIYRIIAAAVFIIGAFLYPFIISFININESIHFVWLYYSLYLLNTSFSYLFVYKTSILVADQKNYILSIITISFNILVLTLQIGVLLLWKSYAAFLLIRLLGTIGFNFYVSQKTDKLYPYLSKEIHLDKLEKKDIYSNIYAMFLYKMSSVLLNGTTNLFISLFAGTIWVGYYANYIMVISGVSTFISALFEGINASVGNLIVRAGADKRKEIFDLILFLGFWIAGWVVTSVYITINTFISLWLGEEYILSQEILNAILINFYLFCAMNPLWSFRNATGLFRETRYIMIFAAGINIILSFFLGEKVGMYGIIASAAISKLLTYFWYEPILLYRNYFRSSAGEYFLKHGVCAILTIVTILITQTIIPESLNETTWTNCIFKISICFITQTMIFTLFLFKRWEYEYFYHKILSVFKYKNIDF